MRFGSFLLALLLLSACTSMMVGGGGGYDASQRSADVVAADSAISSSIAARLKSDPVVGTTGLRVETHKGTVTLSGSVANYSARNQAGRIASDTDGVVNVNNQIVVQN